MFQGKVKTEWLTKGVLSPTVPLEVGTFIIFILPVRKLRCRMISLLRGCLKFYLKPRVTEWAHAPFDQVSRPLGEIKAR
jgi:hypothetical protein